MNSLHINTSRNWAGGERQTLYLLSGLKESGLPVTLAAQPGSPMSKRALEKGIPVREIPMRCEMDISAVRKIRALIKERNPSIVQMHTAHAVTFGGTASHGGAVRIAVRRVDYSIHRKTPFKLSLLKYKLFTDHIICISGAIRDIMIADGIPPEKMSLIYSGIDTGRMEYGSADPGEAGRELGIRPGDTVVGNVAGLMDYKGQKYLIEAAALLREKYPSMKVLIAGEGPLRSELEELAGRRGLRNSVIMPGFRDDVPALFRLMDVFVMSSKTEGLCTSILDAMAAGVPVVASDAGGIGEIVRDGETGVLVEKKNPGALAEGMGKILDNREKASVLARKAKTMVEAEFTVERMVKAHRELYEKLTG